MSGPNGKPLTARQRKKAATRLRIDAAAKAMFAELGYDAVTIRGLAERLSMSTGVIFAHYDDKAALFEGAMGRAAPDQRLRQFLTQLADPPRPTGGLTALPVASPDQLAVRADALLSDLYGRPAAAASPELVA